LPLFLHVQSHAQHLSGDLSSTCPWSKRWLQDRWYNMFALRIKPYLHTYPSRANIFGGQFIPGTLLIPKRRPGHFVAYEWQWTGLDKRGRLDFVQDFWGNLCTTSTWKITLDVSLLLKEWILQKKWMTV
jgi:hypothetical protein